MFQACLVLYLPQPCKPRTLGSFSEEWYLETKIWALFTYCYWGISSPWPSQWIKLRNMCVCMYTHLYPHICIYRLKTMSSHQYLPFQSSTIGFISVPTPLAYLSPFTITENLVSHWLLHINFFAQLPYVINFPIPRGPVKTLPHEITNPGWLSSPHINSLPVAPLLPCYLPLQFTFHTPPSSSGRLSITSP